MGEFYARVANKLERNDFTKPETINLINICLDSGQIATESCPNTVDMAFINGSEDIFEITIYQIIDGFGIL